MPGVYLLAHAHCRVQALQVAWCVAIFEEEVPGEVFDEYSQGPKARVGVGSGRYCSCYKSVRLR